MDELEKELTPRTRPSSKGAFGSGLAGCDIVFTMSKRVPCYVFDGEEANGVMVNCLKAAHSCFPDSHFYRAESGIIFVRRPGGKTNRQTRFKLE